MFRRCGQAHGRDVESPAIVGGALEGAVAVAIAALATHSLVAVAPADGGGTAAFFSFGRGDAGRLGVAFRVREAAAHPTSQSTEEQEQNLNDYADWLEAESTDEELAADEGDD